MRGDCQQNFESELRNIRYQKRIDKESKRKLREIQMEINNFDKSVLKGSQAQGLDLRTQDPGDEKISMTESSDMSSVSSAEKARRKKKADEKKMMSVELFDKEIGQLNEGNFKFCSPEKEIRAQNLADPTFKPFVADTQA